MMSIQNTTTFKICIALHAIGRAAADGPIIKTPTQAPMTFCLVYPFECVLGK